MNCFFCSSEGSPTVACGVCVECGCAACEHHGAVETLRISVRTGNMFEQFPIAVRRFSCAACRALSASQGGNGGRGRAVDAGTRRSRTGVPAG